MLKILTSLSFLYAFVITLLLLYGFLYYRTYVRFGRHRKTFPLVFFLIGAACFVFLWFNMHAPLKLKSFSNLDHHFIRHEGFEVGKSIQLGRTDTASHPNNTYSQFHLAKENGLVTVTSGYSEEPFYAGSKEGFRLISISYPALGHMLSFEANGTEVKLLCSDSLFTLRIGKNDFVSAKLVRKGTSLWNVFKDEPGFINSDYYTQNKLNAALKNIMVLRDDISGKQPGALKYFLSGKLLRFVNSIAYDGAELRLKGQQFKATLPDKTIIAWGTALSENNRNQYIVSYKGGDSFTLASRYPIAYPLIEEDNTNWTYHGVNKFLVSDARDLLGMPAVFKEGFLFTPFSGDSSIDFAPVLLTYHKKDGNKGVHLRTQWLNVPGSTMDIAGNRIVLPAKSGNFGWLFSIRNTFNWEFGNTTMAPGKWQIFLFGTLALFFLIVWLTALLQPSEKLSWVWQLLSGVTLVLLTTRFFLYWRYKSFPPYEGLDAPSEQQLNSFWNFGVIIFAGILLSVIFGFNLWKQAYGYLLKQLGRFRQPSFDYKPSRAWKTEQTAYGISGKFSLQKLINSKAGFFLGWLILLASGSAFAAFRNFDPGTCRHLAIGLIIVYFYFVYHSYRHSPLVASAEESWWKLSTGKITDIIVSNPVKVFLSVSLIAVFVFIDIGFAIVFVNFLLFNEAFLCINYAIAGLSAGSGKNARAFGFLGAIYLILFAMNLIYAPYIIKYILELPQTLYLAGYALFAMIMAYNLTRLLRAFSRMRKMTIGATATVLLFLGAFFFFPKERILEKAESTKYRIDVLTMPVNKAIENAYKEGNTYEPVIRAAQNQWFINTFIYEKNNPGVNSAAFHLLPHAPQHKGARYNAQATDLVASRFFIAEHGKWSVLLFVFLLLLPTTMMASFYKLYPDFTNRINTNYPTITAGFSILNYLLITALLVILAATGRYIFFGQDLPFGSILSKQSILFPSLLIIGTVVLFSKIPLEQYANRKKFIPGILVFSGLAALLFFFKPEFNKNKEFTVADLAKDMDGYIQQRLQPIMDHFDTAASTRRLPIAKKDQLFTDSVRKLIVGGLIGNENKFFLQQVTAYINSTFSGHLDQRKMLYLDLYSGKPQLSVNDNYFRIMPPPHLQQAWRGNVFGDTSVYHVSLWDVQSGRGIERTLHSYTNVPNDRFHGDLGLSFRAQTSENIYERLYLVNNGNSMLRLKSENSTRLLAPHDSLLLVNPVRILIMDSAMQREQVLTVEPDAFMKNFYVNGSRFYMYPMQDRFIWARNFAESISSEYTSMGQQEKNAFVSFDYELMDSLSAKIHFALQKDTAYKKGAEYGICIADGNGRLIALNDFIKDLERPDPNDKPGFNRAMQGEDGFISQSVLRKQIGNINLLRLNPGPGSTLKPVVFSAIASQLDLDWSAFGAEGFSEKQQFFGGEKVAQYDFEKNNGRISKVTDYLRLSDNYYHSNLLLLGSYPKQKPGSLLSKHFVTVNPGQTLHWPYFDYKGSTYWLESFESWPGFLNGRANFGSDSSFTSIGLSSNYGILTRQGEQSFDKFSSTYDSLLFMNAYKRSGFILPESGLFDQQANGTDHRIPYDLFTMSFRGHVKGSSQVMIPPVKMLDIFGKLITQNRNYSLTLNPYGKASGFTPFYVDSSITYNNYLSLMREEVYSGMREALFKGTATRLGTFLKDGAPWFYYAKTGTTGDDEARTKSKLFTLIISQKDISNPDFNFRNNKFYIIYFTSQNGPAKQNEELQAAVIKYLEQSPAFNRYMYGKN